jgi:hypothetical protein
MVLISLWSLLASFWEARMNMEETADQEIATMSAIAKALDAIKEDHEVLQRVLQWAAARYDVGDIGNLSKTAARGKIIQGDGKQDSQNSTGNSTEFSDVAELFDAADPKTDWQKALVVGYWLVKGANQDDFAGADVNSQLKHLGHGVVNITDSLNKSMQRKPAFVIQTAKSGASKQARKKYKITKAGMTAVEAMIKGVKPGDE